MAQAGWRGVVTPEAVVLQFETAGLGSRVVAALLDLLAQGGVLVLGAFGLGLLAAADVDVGGTLAAILLAFLVFAALFVYPVAFETLWRGRTPGKAALGLRVVTHEGAPLRFRHAAVRGALLLVDLWATSGAGAVLSILLTRDSQRLGDLAAGTIVVRERSAAGPATAVRFSPPPGWDAYAATLDTSALSVAEYGTVRSFLLRAPSLTEGERGRLAARLAAAVAERLRTAPAAGLAPEAFLTCAAAAYQHRHEPPQPASPSEGAPATGTGWGWSPWERHPPPPPAAPGDGARDEPPGRPAVATPPRLEPSDDAAGSKGPTPDGSAEPGGFVPPP